MPIYGLVCTFVGRDGRELPAEAMGWRSGPRGGIDVFGDGLEPESFGNTFALCLLGLSEQEVYHCDEPGGALVRWLAQPSAASLRGAVSLNLPGYLERTEEFVVPRIGDRIERSSIVLDPAPGITFGDLEVTLRVGRRFDRAAMDIWSRLRIGGLLMQRIDGGDSEHYAYPLIGVLDAPQSLRGIPCGRYEMSTVLGFESDTQEGSRPKQVVEVTSAGGQVEFDLTQMGSLEVTLLDIDANESDYSGSAYAILSRPKGNVGGKYHSLGWPPFVAPVVPPGEYRIDLRLDSASRFGRPYTVLKFDDRVEIVGGRTTRMTLTAKKP